jgi:hypothetical protein
MAMYHEKFTTFQKDLGAMDGMVSSAWYCDFDQLATTEDVPILVDFAGGQAQSIVAILDAHEKIDLSNCI